MTKARDSPEGDAHEDVARLFREHDDLGTGSSLWLRPLRQLFAEGKPVGPVIVLTFPVGSRRFPFGVVSSTSNNRLIF
jgi:hypothetical protein